MALCVLASSAVSVILLAGRLFMAQSNNGEREDG